VKRQRTITVLLLSTALFACSSTESDWNKAQSANTVTAYQDFLKQHPDGPHAQEARNRVQKMTDDQAWSEAQATNTVEAYQQYLQKEPTGTHAQDAQTQITSLQRAAAWKTAQAANTEPALQEFLQKYSSGPEVEQARAQLQKLQSEGYRVQLGSFRDQKDAEKSRDNLKSRLSGTVQDVEIIPPSQSEKRYRVASGPMTEQDAKSACARLKKEHQHCEVVKR
jgi:cell division protein FtsN